MVYIIFLLPAPASRLHSVMPSVIGRQSFLRREEVAAIVTPTEYSNGFLHGSYHFLAPFGLGCQFGFFQRLLLVAAFLLFLAT